MRPETTSARRGTRPGWAAPGVGRLDAAETVLGDSLPVGPYRFTVLVHANWSLTELPAGRVFVTTDPRPLIRAPRGLSYQVRTSLVGHPPPRILIGATLVNSTERRVLVDYGACALHLLVYRNADRTGIPMWNSAHQVDRTGQTPVCFLYEKLRELGPGETHRSEEFSGAYRVANILGDSLPAGRYYFTARLEIGGETVAVPAGSATLR